MVCSRCYSLDTEAMIIEMINMYIYLYKLVGRPFDHIKQIQETNPRKIKRGKVIFYDFLIFFGVDFFTNISPTCSPSSSFPVDHWQFRRAAGQ